MLETGIRTVKILVAAMCAALAVSSAGPSRAQSQDELYRTGVIVTGEREETRYPGFAEAMKFVLVKASGRPEITAHPGFAAIVARARAMVWSYTYHDRLFGRPIRDEQGTRDRPFDLTVQFDAKQIDAALATLGVPQWPAPRPKLALLVRVSDMVRSYVLAEGEYFGADQRSAFHDASARFAVPIVFPESRDLEKAGINAASFDRLDDRALDGIRRQLQADGLLTGEIEWSPSDLGWKAEWRLVDASGGTWGIRGVNFDEAFRNAIAGAASHLSRKQP